MEISNLNINDTSNNYYKISSELKDYKLLSAEASAFYRDLANQYDSRGNIDKKVGEEISELFEDAYMIGIHRTGYTPINEAYLSDVFTNGLINNGDLMQGVNSNILSLEKIVTFYNDKIIYFTQLKATPNYKNSEGTIIIKIPKPFLDKDSDEVKPIYFKNDNEIRLLPEYIYGYVPISNEYDIKEIIHNPNYSDLHDYSNEGLLYEGDEVILNDKRK